jgi:hypothetical protein
MNFVYFCLFEGELSIRVFTVESNKTQLHFYAIHLMNTTLLFTIYEMFYFQQFKQNVCPQ